jgi:hypothetical protein
VSNRVSRRQGQRWADQDAAQAPAPEPQQYAEPPAPPQSRIDKLKELGTLRDQGVLTDEEFAAEKNRVLAG